jgi:hypothetical protein
MSALHAILPNLEPDAPRLPRGAVDLGNGYILLRVRDASSVAFNGERAEAIHAFLATELRQEGIPEDWQPRYIQWAQLCLLNMQISCCVWKETVHASSAESICRS